MVCYIDAVCHCLLHQKDCQLSKASNCNSSELLYVGQSLDYSALHFIKPYMNSSIDSCKKACLRNCSCNALFFESSSGNCFLFDIIGSLKRAKLGSSGFVSYVKVARNESGWQNHAEEGRKDVTLLLSMDQT
ncbi:hypothetical protein PTKIN_Ptkin14bG0030500 [Pterospermum kingtungense]